MMKSLAYHFVFGALAVLGAAQLASELACTPAQRAAVPATERATCVLLRAIDPSVGPVCATADDLAPFVPVILEAQRSEPATAQPAPLVAFSMPAPSSRKPARRHCAQWTYVDGGGADAP